MTRTGTPVILAAMLTLGAAIAPLYAQEMSSARIKELIREAALQAAKRDQQPATPGAPGATGAPARVKVPLTLDDAVKLALDRNLDIAVQRLNP